MKKYALPELRYDYAALEPHYSARLLELHHGKHHAAYVAGANATLQKLAAAREQRDFSAINRGSGQYKEGKQIMATRISIFALAMGIVILPLHGATAAETVVPSADVAQTIVINDLAVQYGSVSGTVVNKSSATVYDVELLVRQMWLWNDELHPGADSPGRALPFTLRQDVAPHASAAFAFQMPPLPQRSDGRFVTTVEVTRFSEVGL